MSDRIFRQNYCVLDCSVRVEAAGYKTWEAPLTSLFGARYDYSKHGTNLNHTVVLFR